MNSLLHILCQRGSGIHAPIDLLVQKAVFVSDHKASLGTIFGDQPSSFAAHVAYLIRRGSKFSTNAYVNNAPKRSNASMISARVHIRERQSNFQHRRLLRLELHGSNRPCVYRERDCQSPQNEDRATEEFQARSVIPQGRPRNDLSWYHQQKNSDHSRNIV